MCHLYLTFYDELKQNHGRCCNCHNSVNLFYSNLFFCFRNQLFENHPEHGACCEPQTKRKKFFKYQYKEEGRNGHKRLGQTAENTPKGSSPNTCSSWNQNQTNGQAFRNIMDGNGDGYECAK